MNGTTKRPVYTGMYYIQHVGFAGDDILFWKPEQCGYTVNLDAAGRYTKEEAESIVQMRPGHDFMFPCQAVDSIAQRHVNSESIGWCALRDAVKSRLQLVAKSS